MNRAVLLWAIPLALTGCNFQSEVKPTSTTPPPPPEVTVATPAEPAVKPVPVQTVSPAVPPPATPAAAAGYFEMKQDGKMYVFNDVPTMQKVAAGETPSTMAVVERGGPNGETVIVQAAKRRTGRRNRLANFALA